MKKLLLLILIIGLGSCKKDSSAHIDASTAIVGKWVIKNYAYVYYMSGKEVFRRTDVTITPNTAGSKYYQFAADGTYNQYAYFYDTYALVDADGKYSLTSDNKTISFTSNTFLFPGTYDLSFPDNNSLVLGERQTIAGSLMNGNVIVNFDSYSHDATYNRY